MRTFSVILADDEPQILHGMQNGIPWKELGFTVVAAAGNGQEALEYTQNLHPDLLISDIKMPFLDGLELAKILHEEFIQIKIVLFSGWDDFEYARRAIRYGVSEYVLKPVDYDGMERLLKKLHAELEEEFDARTNREKMEIIYQESMPLLRQQFFTRLLQEDVRRDWIMQQIQMLNLSLDYPVFSIALISTQKPEDVMMQISVTKIIEEMLEKVCTVYSFGLYDKKAYLLCLSSADDGRLVMKSLIEAANITQKMLQTKFFCGLGMSCTSLEQLSQSYRQAKEALEYNVVSKEDDITFYGDISPNPLAEYPDWIAAAEPLERAIKHGDDVEIRKAVDQLLAQLREYHYSFNEYQIIILEIIFSLSKLYRRYQITGYQELAGSKHMAMKILSLRTGEELNNWLYNYCEFTSRSIRKYQMDQNAVLANQAKDYVERYFSRADLSVETMCRALNVSASHFSKVFRRETGSSFLNYLTQKRMEEAERLLTTTDYKSRVIGEMVGYPEPNYFSYVFKKNQGVSPARYRKQRKADGEG